MPPALLGLQDLRRLLEECAGVADEPDRGGDFCDADLQDLGYDSIAVMEVAARITREYGLEIDDEALAGATTPRLLLDLVNGSPQRQ